MPDYPAGAGPAGFAPVAEGTPTPAGDAARSLFFDLETRTAPPLADGSMQEIHWVDAEVILALGFELGSIKSAPEVGTETRRLKNAPRQAIQSITTDVVKVALRRLLARGDVELLRVETSATPGRLLYAVTYVNLRLSAATRKPTTLRMVS